MLWTCSEREFARWASEDLRRWREHDAATFTRRADYMRQAARPRAGEAPWHEAEAEAPPAPAPRPARPAGPAPSTPASREANRQAGARQRSALAAGCRHHRRWETTAAGVPDGVCGDCPMRAQESGRAPAPAASVAVSPGAAVALASSAAMLGRPSGPMVLVQRPRIDGAHVLDQVHGFLAHFAVWPSDACLVAAAGFVAQCHARDPKTKIPVGPYAPHWLLLGEAGSGKTWMARIMSKLVPSGQLLVEATKASLVQAIYERAIPVVDETDVLFGSGQRNAGVRALLNAAYEQDQHTSYMQGRQCVRVPLTTSVIMAALNKLRDGTGNDLKTLLSRCLIAQVQTAPEGYRPPRFDSQARAVAALLSQRLGAWLAQEVADGIGDEVPDVPAGLGNRPAALWEPLLVAADRAGGHWPDAMRDACARMESATGLPGDDEAAAGRIDQWLDQWAADGLAPVG
jgi:Protein of unknown function (DUF3631)